MGLFLLVEHLWTTKDSKEFCNPLHCAFVSISDWCSCICISLAEIITELKKHVFQHTYAYPASSIDHLYLRILHAHLFLLTVIDKRVDYK